MHGFHFDLDGFHFDLDGDSEGYPELVWPKVTQKLTEGELRDGKVDERAANRNLRSFVFRKVNRSSILLAQCFQHQQRQLLVNCEHLLRSLPFDRKGILSKHWNSKLEFQNLNLNFEFSLWTKSFRNVRSDGLNSKGQMTSKERRKDERLFGTNWRSQVVTIC